MDEYALNLRIFDPLNLPEDMNLFQFYGIEEIKYFSRFYSGKDYEFDPIKTPENLIAE